MQVELISEHDASSIAGVSPKTLSRFAEAGYLQVENSTEGSKFYSKMEVLELFGIMDQNFYDKLANDLSSAAKPHETVQSVPQTQQTPSVSVQAEDMAAEVKLEKFVTPGSSATISTAELSSAAAVASHELEEISKLKNILSLQEKILDMKDERIRSLMQETGWLRERIEKLEQKSERDQLLILSESQTVRRLIIMSHEKKSPLRTALEWLGLVTPSLVSTDLKSTIESDAGKHSAS